MLPHQGWHYGNGLYYDMFESNNMLDTTNNKKRRNKNIVPQLSSYSLLRQITSLKTGVNDMYNLNGAQYQLII